MRATPPASRSRASRRPGASRPGDGQLGADGRFVAYRPGIYTVTATLGRRAASATVKVRERDVRRSVTVVGRLPRTAFATSEVWIHPNGKVAYLGTHGGGDRVYAIDISNPARPVVVDSIQANTRLVNDMQTTADGNYMVFTREGAADRKNGIVIADTRDPLHPKEIAQFVDGVAAGVHSVYIYENPQYGRYVFITNDGTGAIDIVNITDPAKPTRAGEWRTNRPDAARYVHDLDIVDGLMYASYWNDGLVILDIGNGKWGGRPDKPVLVSQFKYDLDSLYREVEDVSGTGLHPRHPHGLAAAGRQVRLHRRRGLSQRPDRRRQGRLVQPHVRHASGGRRERHRASEGGGLVHAGERRRAQRVAGGGHALPRAPTTPASMSSTSRVSSRATSARRTARSRRSTPPTWAAWCRNAAFTWGVVVNPKDGLAYVNDFNNGLWVVRDESRSRPGRR